MVGSQGNVKRVRQGGDENAAKRARNAISGGEILNSMQKAAGTTPRSPASSSRSRKGGNKKSRDKESNVRSSATSGSPRARSKLQNGAKLASDLDRSSFLILDDVPLAANIKSTVPQKRIYGHEIQCMMHSFGEIRFPCREVVEMVEDITRETVRAFAFAAAQRALEDSTRVRKSSLWSSGSITLSLDNVVSIVEQDVRLTNRLSVVLNQIDREKFTPVAKNILSRRLHLLSSQVDALRELEYIQEEEETSSGPRQREVNFGILNDAAMLCSYRMQYLVRPSMSRAQFADFRSCREVSYVRGESRSRATPMSRASRVKAFQDWLDFSGKDGIMVTEDALYALGHIAWEVTGTITQSALMYRHFDDIAQGKGDPRESEWTMGRHMIAALRHGLSTGIFILATSIQLQEISREIDKFSNLPGNKHPFRWQGYGRNATPCLHPKHIREALRRSQRAPDQSYGLSASLVDSFLGRCRM